MITTHSPGWQCTEATVGQGKNLQFQAEYDSINSFFPRLSTPSNSSWLMSTNTPSFWSSQSLYKIKAGKSLASITLGEFLRICCRSITNQRLFGTLIPHQQIHKHMWLIVAKGGGGTSWHQGLLSFCLCFIFIT